MISEGRVAVVTGGGSGIGRQVCLKLAESGAKVVIADYDPDKAIGVIRELEKMGAHAMVLEGDVSDKDDVKRVMDTVVERWGKIDILVNCAGILIDATLKKLSEDTWDKVHRINLKGTLFCIQAVMESMSENKYGRIINMASGAYLGNFGQAAYASSKAGIVSLTKTAALELARNNITVNCVAPGLVETPMTESMPPEAFEKIAKGIPMGRIGKPEDIAYIILCLAADEAAYTTGQVIHVDGGSTTGIRA